MNGSGREMRQIKRTRNEILVALKVVYPAALQAEHVLRGLVVLFPTVEFEQVKRDLHYLTQKGYAERVLLEDENGNGLTPWRKRWFRLTASGLELADKCIRDPALEE